MARHRTVHWFAATVMAALALGAFAPAVAAQTEEEGYDYREPQRTQPDFTVVNLPTTLGLPPAGIAFRVTHRFTRPLGQGSFADSLSDLFGLDSSAQVGLELRFGLPAGLQAGIYRTNDKTIDLFAHYGLLRPSDDRVVSIALTASVEGADNFKDDHAPSVGAVVGVRVGQVLALYLQPAWVGNTRTALSDAPGDDDSTFLLGLGGRLLVRRGLYLVAEAAPRLAGFKGGSAVAGSGGTVLAFGVEKQVGGHVFQVNVSNGFATMPAKLARGTAGGETEWYLGFTISRKFY
ncbi:MAG TPA: DUF5777 family beta-barrel protein [Vicinamibacterales bacterium]|nr:DUF5777 family beta-barrel protein [Vicinamibacterales bacterium]